MKRFAAIPIEMVDFGRFRWISVDLDGFRWISGEIWDFVLGSLVPGWLEISFNSIENMENASIPDSDRERSVSPPSGSTQRR